ncbi:allantoin permease [Mycobacterium saskatchewanense]|uniref:Allantoin permease n=1 Tax=Mycobacterium saskatchewanense TaxID=220927 RepID=A0A7I7LRA0_9MYCO|nr:cytosine permease [Mycobacterium saskatchewanense]BBX62127.1 allantoin permease [Mycobacterium saskatchewanense]
MEPTTRTVHVEQVTIAPIPQAARRGRARALFPIWFGVQIMPLTVVTGVLGTTVYGLSAAWTIVAVAIGNMIGAIFVALHSVQGPRLGVPQMVQSRGQFGLRGSLLVLAVVVLMYVGFLASILVLAASSLQVIFPRLGSTPALIISGAITLLLVVFGYEMIHKVNRLLMPSFAIASIISLAYLLAHGVSNSPAATSGQFTVHGFMGMLSVAAIWQLAYAPYVSDYSRYLPVGVSSSAAFWATYLGSVGGAIPMMVIGALLGQISDGSLKSLNALLPSGVGVFVIAVFFLGAVDACTVNLYGPALCVATTIQTFKTSWLPGAGSRITIAGIVTLLSVYIAAGFSDDFLVSYSNFIQILLYFLIPWSVINLVDYYLIRKADYDVESFFRPDGGIYGHYNAAAVVAYVIGVLVQVPFMSGNLYTGIVARRLDGVDIAWIVGSFVSFAVYYFLLMRRDGPSQSRTHRRPAPESLVLAPHYRPATDTPS